MGRYRVWGYGLSNVQLDTGSKTGAKTTRGLPKP